MTTAAAANWTIAITLLLISAAIWVILRRHQRHLDRQAPTVAPAPVGHDVGPDALLLLEDADAHITEYVAEDPDLFEVFGPDVPVPNLGTHPDAAAGFDRLRQAIRDHREDQP